jgi:hypothetical protein
MQSNTDRAGFDRLAAHGAQRPTSAADIAERAVRDYRKRRNEKRAARMLTFVSLFLSAWLFMLAVGIARAHWLPDLPTIDYGTTLLLLGFLGGAIFARAVGIAAIRTRSRN